MGTVSGGNVIKETENDTESGMLLIFTGNFQVYHDPETPSRVAVAEVDGTGPLRDGVDGMRAIQVPNRLHLSATASERPHCFTMSVQVELDFPLGFFCFVLF